MIQPARCWLAVSALTTPGLVCAQVVPTDPDFDLQWSLLNTGQTVEGQDGVKGADIAAPLGWSVYDGTRRTLVAVVGPGVTSHPEFADRLLAGIATQGDPYDTRDLSSAGSGTAAAGVIAAAADNGLGIAGLHSRALLLPVRAFSGVSARADDLAAGVRWAVDQGASVVLVLARLIDGSADLEAAVAYANERDVLCIAPAGDPGGAAGEVAYPAFYDGCLAVSATDNRDQLAGNSGYGPQIDLSAPGTAIWTTSRSGAYEYQSTSVMAAALVAGAAGLIRSYHPQLPATDVRALLLDNSDDLGPAEWDQKFGAGRLNLERALIATPPPPLRIELFNPLPSTVPPGEPFAIRLRIVNGTQSVQPGKAVVRYRIDGGEFQGVSLNPLGDAIYEAVFPPAACGSTLEYYFEAVGDQGAVVTEPLAAPDELYTAQITRLETLFNDDFESDQGWTTIVEQPDDTRGAWTRVVPVGTGVPGIVVQPGYDYSPNEKTHCLMTGQGNANVSPNLTDVDVGPVILISPVIPMDSPDAVVSYARWYFCNSVDNPDPLVVEVSRDGGTTWAVVETVIASQSQWEVHSFRLSSFPQLAGNLLRVRFTIADPPEDDSLTEAGVDEFRVTAVLCSPATGDADGDGRVGLPDVAAYTSCLLGPNGGLAAPACSTFDFDGDGQIDLRDGRHLTIRFNP